MLVYAAKFLCGRLESDPKLEPPVGPGSYTTAINVHNPNRRPVVIIKKAVLLFFVGDSREELEIPRPPGRRYLLELGPDWGVEIDCRDIREHLLRGEQGATATFIKGWVVLESNRPLDVEVVYTAQGLQGGGIALTTERVHPAKAGRG